MILQNFGKGRPDYDMMFHMDLYGDVQSISVIFNMRSQRRYVYAVVSHSLCKD